MGLAHSSKIVTDGLMFYVDMNNTSKSWRGKPATNFLTNGHFSGGIGVTQESGSNATNEIIPFPNPGSSDYVLRQTGTVPFTEYQLNLTTELVSGLTYVMSGWYGESPNYSSADGSRMFHSAAFSASGANVSLGIGIGTVLQTKVVNGITWKYCYATITTPADYNNVFHWYVGYGGSAYTGHRYYTDLQVEIGTFPSRFTNGTRFNTQVLLDFIGKNTVTAPSLTYANNNTFSFNGTTDYIDISNTSLISGTNPFTIESWTNKTSGAYGAILNNYGSGYSSGLWFATAGYFLNGVSVYHTDYENSMAGIHHSAVTRDPLGNVVLYRDGIQVNSGISTSSIPSNINWRIGSDVNVFGEPIIGNIYSVKTYNRVLTASEIRQNFNAHRGIYGI